MSMNKLLKAGCLTGFVPHRLQIPDRPELAVFPANVLFEKSLIKIQSNLDSVSSKLDTILEEIATTYSDDEE